MINTSVSALCEFPYFEVGALIVSTCFFIGSISAYLAASKMLKKASKIVKELNDKLMIN